ncbi:MAG: TrbG/VirB9 family P-type conjugative transfer protein, partial [Pseudomonadota bacterium]
MKRFIIAVMFSSTILLMPTKAEQSAESLEADTRIKEYVYDENNVYKLDLHLKSVSALQFEENENVESILIGDSASWEVVKLSSGNVISIKPIIDDALTNMTVYTDKRVYTFELQSIGEIQPGPKLGAGQAFRAHFTYPAEIEKSAEEENDDFGKFEPGPIEDNYLIAGSGDFRPIAVSDNSYQTTFTLPPGSPRPAVFKVGKDEKERLVNSRTLGDHIIVDGTADYWVMRIGDDMICVGLGSVIRQRIVSEK